MMTGIIRNGDMTGFFIRLVPDTGDTGGYYILFSKDFNRQDAGGYDEWYASLCDAQRRLEDFQIDRYTE